MDDEKKTSDTAEGSGRAAPPGTGFRADALGSLWQTALGQIDEIRDVIVRGSQAGKAKLDVQLLRRQREKLLVQLGEAVLDEHTRAGAPLPASCDDLKTQIDDVDRQIADAESDAEKALKR